MKSLHQTYHVVYMKPLNWVRFGFHSTFDRSKDLHRYLLFTVKKMNTYEFVFLVVIDFSTDY